MTLMTEKFGPDVRQRFQAVRQFATRFTPRLAQGYTLYNGFFNPLTTLDLSAIADTKAFLQEKGTFCFESHPQSGLVKTSETIQATMLRQWFTDSVMVGYWQRPADPKGWQRSMITQAGLMSGDAVASIVDTVEHNPDWYRLGDLSHGIFHMYLPESLTFDTEGLVNPDSVKQDDAWDNRKRLESQAQVLYWIAKTWLATDKPWGFEAAYRTGKPLDFIQKAVNHLTRYILAVTTDGKTGQPDFHTPSCSSWEEYPFADGMTSDAGFMVLALEAVKTLKNHHPDWALPDDSRLDAHIKVGRHYIDQRVTQPLHNNQPVIQTALRPMDLSLTFLAASDYRFIPDNDLADCQIRTSLVKQCMAGLMGPYGMRRYNHYTLQGISLFDNYLNYAANFPRELYAQLLGESLSEDPYFIAGDDTSTPEALLSRQKTSRFEYTAEWGLGLSASLQALIACRQCLKTDSTPALNTLIMDLYNRCMAVIPETLPGQPDLLRADGSPCPDYAAMESYQVVPNEAGQPVWLPGAHTLPWHAAQLFDALNQLHQSGYN